MDEVDQIVKDNVEFKAVETVDEILSEALVSMPKTTAEEKEFYNITKSAKPAGTAVHN